MTVSTKPSAPLEILVGRQKAKEGRFLTGSAKSARKTDVLVVFLTGNELGALKPCGCSGGQLGGLDRRSAVFESVCAEKRLIVDTGSFVKAGSEQDLIKFNIVIQAFSLLGYDLVNLTKKDIEIAGNLGLLDSIGSLFNVISCHSVTDVNLPTKFAKQLSLEGKTVVVTVAAVDAESASGSPSIEQISEFFTPPRLSCESKRGGQKSDLQTVNILILDWCDADVIASIAKIGIVDCLVCPAESDEPTVFGDPNERPLVLYVGRLGKYVGRLQITAAQATPASAGASSPPRKQGLKVNFSAIPVTEDLPQETFLLELYKAYQQFVRQADLLAKQPRFALSDGLEYTGSQSCKLCHNYEYEKWSTRAHAHAYATLERVGSQYDPECVLCHVVGMQYESGFVSEEISSHLKNVGCENCHGPGSEHIRTLGKAETTEPRSGCADCHTPETSGDYTPNEQFYFEKIVHWREPNASGNVK